MTEELSNQLDFEAHLSFGSLGDVTASYEHISLASVFQPIVDRTRTVVGFEALSRVRDDDGNAVSSTDVFAHCADDSRVTHQHNLDRLSRVIHLRNFSQYQASDQLLFLNILPTSAIRVLSSEANLELMLRRLDVLGIDAQQVILEVLEHNSDSDRSLAMATARHLSSGFQIAIDDFGVDASQEDRVRSVRPNILKIDRSLLRLYGDGTTGRLLHSLEVAADVGARTLVEGIEHEDDLQAMMDLNVDLFQGFHLGEPNHLSVYCARK